MTEFKAGDRVEYQIGIDEEGPANGGVGTVLGKSMYSTPSRPRVRVAWDDSNLPAYHPLTSHLRPAKPQKATPALGDIVRMVFEGKVIDGGFGFLHLEGGITLGTETATLIEIITPAKPSVADLPVAERLWRRVRCLLGTGATRNAPSTL